MCNNQMLVVVADDFTGAAEVAGLCLDRGVSVGFLANIPDEEALKAMDCRVLVIAEDTRSYTADGAEKVSRLLAERLKQAGLTRVGKKIDSALRGWVLPEMNAMAAVLGKQALYIQPANPVTGRSIREGLYYIGETLLSDTAFARDPEFPARTSSVNELLESRRAGAECLPYRVPDAATNEDIRRGLASLSERELPGGSAAFWREYISAAIEAGEMPCREVPAPSSDEFLLNDCLMVCGSAHLNSIASSDYLKQQGFPVEDMPDEMLHEDKPSDEAFYGFVDRCVNTWKRHRRLLIRYASHPVSFDNCAERLRYRMTESVFYILKQIQVSQILIEGGATAYSILQRMGWDSFTPVREWMPGVVQLSLNGRPNCYLTLKPGSYPWPPFRL